MMIFCPQNFSRLCRGITKESARVVCEPRAGGRPMLTNEGNPLC